MHDINGLTLLEKMKKLPKEEYNELRKVILNKYGRLYLIGTMNLIKQQAEEIVLNKLIYTYNI